MAVRKSHARRMLCMEHGNPTHDACCVWSTGIRRTTHAVYGAREYHERRLLCIDHGNTTHDARCLWSTGTHVRRTLCVLHGSPMHDLSCVWGTASLRTWLSTLDGRVGARKQPTNSGPDSSLMKRRGRSTRAGLMAYELETCCSTVRAVFSGLY